MMRKIFILIVAVFVGVCIIYSQSASSCTIFCVNGQSANYFASNEDWTFTDPAMRIVPGDKNYYGYIVFGWNSYLPNYPQGGVNEYGLSLDWAALTSQNFKQYPNRKELGEDITYKILKECRNVKDVINLVKQYNCPHFAEEHLLVADRNGASCVIEWSGSDYQFLRKRGHYQVITNFCLSNPKIGWYPCQRFKVVDDYLADSKNSAINLETVKSLLQKSHQEGSYPTVYSYIVDEQNLMVYIFLNHDYSKCQNYDLRRELSYGSHQIILNE
jgi:hypothetical protein